MSEAREEKTELAIPKTDIANPESMVAFANVLKSVIVKQKLYTEIRKGQNHVNVEGWQFAGAAMGVYPIVASVQAIAPFEFGEETGSDGKTLKPEIKYRAEVKLVKVGTDVVVGHGVAVCSNREGGRANQDEYVIASMAQTRAEGKAYRLSFGWLMKLAGYEPVVPEEMEGRNDVEASADIRGAILNAKTHKEVHDVLNGLTPEEKKSVAGLVSDRLTELGTNQVVEVEALEGKTDDSPAV